MESQRRTGQGEAVLALGFSFLAAAAAAAAALGCDASQGSLAILGHCACTAWPQHTSTGAKGTLLRPSLDAREAERQLSIGDKVHLQQSGALLRFCTTTITVAIVQRSTSDRTLQLQPVIVVGCLQGCA